MELEALLYVLHVHIHVRTCIPLCSIEQVSYLGPIVQNCSTFWFTWRTFLTRASHGSVTWSGRTDSRRSSFNRETKREDSVENVHLSVTDMTLIFPTLNKVYTCVCIHTFPVLIHVLVRASLSGYFVLVTYTLLSSVCYWINLIFGTNE